MRCRRLIVTAVGALSGLCAAAAQAGPPAREAPVVAAGHPRLFITPCFRADIRQRCSVSHKEAFERLSDHVGGRRGGRAGLDWHGLAYLGAYGFLYQMTDDEKYAKQAGAVMDRLARGWPRDPMLSTYYLRSAALAYDWCHDAFSGGQRERYARAMARAAGHIERAPREPDYSHDLAVTRLSLLWVGVALADDGIVDRDARRWVLAGSALLREHVLPAGNAMARDSGGHAEGFYYAPWGYLAPVAQTVELWRVASGENLFLGAPVLSRNALWNVYCRRPFDGALIRADDCPSRRTWRQADEGIYMPLLAARYQDGLAQWVSRSIRRTHAQLLWTDILWEDRAIPPAAPKGLPTSWLFEGLGWAVMRSGWENPRDTLAVFQCGPLYSGRQHLDNNSFVIHKIRPLAIDSGVAEPTAHRANYAGRSIAHNTVLILDDAEAFTDAAGKALANDGGQLRLAPPSRVGDVRAGSKYETGRIVAYEHRPPYTYVAGDATESYAAAKLDSFVRQVVYIRPNLFIVYDRVAATRPDFRKTWLLHTISEPFISGSLVAVTDRRSHKLYCRTLLPDGALVGRLGPGREFRVGGHDYRPGRKTDPEAGMWRLEVTPRDEHAVEEFLHVLYACEHVRERMPPARMVTEGKRVGVRGQAGGIAYTVWFNRTGPSGGHIQLTRGRDPVLARNFPVTIIQDPVERMIQRWAAGEPPDGERLSTP